MSCGRASAAELTLTLSAPASSTAVASSTVRMPPPNVNGIETCSATRPATSSAEARDSIVADDVEEHELVGACVGVGRAELDRIADVAEILEADALDDAAVRHVEARDQTRERHRSRKRAPAAPLFSGWNWTPTNASYSAMATSPSLVAVAAGVSAA